VSVGHDAPARSAVIKTAGEPERELAHGQILVAAGRDGRIISADPADGTPIEVTVRDGVWFWTPAGTVVVTARAAGSGTDGGSFEVMCPHTVFHASRPSARAWLADRGGLDAEILDQEGDIECGRPGFGTLTP
jgi:Alkylmercury lyase